MEAVEQVRAGEYRGDSPSFIDNRIRELLTIKDVARLLRCSEVTVRHWVQQGKIPTVRPVPRMVRFDTRTIEKWLSERVA